MMTFEYLADVLGLRATAKEQIGHSTFALIARIEGGLPVAALERVARLLAPDDVQFKYRIVPKATYERRKLAHKLSADESARLARVARVAVPLRPGVRRMVFGRRGPSRKSPGRIAMAPAPA